MATNIVAQEQVKKDILTCLGIWLTLELICFTILPLIELVTPGDRFQTWFLISLPMGVGGSLLTGIGTHLFWLLGNPTNLLLKALLWLIKQISVWVGLLGIAFPLLVICIEFFTELIAQQML
ncbi:hypothetical protein IQ268_27020 [Oculatella sp. LEGE 06141]|uniref:hypothetical protein n=1 Tax=Oculatella sp. LEGE 06141 TaxID=1828648 RepID=UPI0018822141|nr:hypothetical protein [Oculatella sp. LEGE 06141]MBE9182223.1 hypothetical protein [Oculatella sp. LEGE 06141]